MGYEQINLNFEEDNKPQKRIVSYSERQSKPGESDEQYMERIFSLTRASISGEVIFAEPTPDEINQELAMSKFDSKKKISKNEISKPKDEEKTIDYLTQKKIDQMKSRKDLDY